MLKGAYCCSLPGCAVPGHQLPPALQDHGDHLPHQGGQGAADGVSQQAGTFTLFSPYSTIPYIDTTGSADTVFCYKRITGTTFTLSIYSVLVLIGVVELEPGGNRNRYGTGFVLG